MQRIHGGTLAAAGMAICTGTLAASFVWAGLMYLEERRASDLLAISPLGQLDVLAEAGRFAALKSRNMAPFEGGNIGSFRKTSSHSYTAQMRSDNDDALPHSWRQWYYFGLDDLPTDEPVTLTIEGLGIPHYFLPFYSLDNIDWIQFPESAVKQIDPQTLQITHKFKQPKIWFARYIPYTYTRLVRYLDGIKQNPDVKITSIGRTPGGKSIPLLTITEQQGINAKERVIIHARTHPGEVGSSLVLEGLINFLLSDAESARSLRSRVIFSIIPMVNVDGVVAGNNRTNTAGINLEGQWIESAKSRLKVDSQKTPLEIKLLNKAFRDMIASGVPITVALNLHTSAGQPNDNVFAFPHFGPMARGYTAREAQLYDKQIKFINLLSEAYGQDRLMAPPSDGGSFFLARRLPETWWWFNFQDRVMALTLESTYGLAGKTGRWVKPRDLRALGESLAQAIGGYHESALALGRTRRPMVVQ
jgi:hypothetical protein